MTEDVEIIDLTSTSELLSGTEYSRKCIAEGDDETALKSLEKVLNVNPRSIPTLLERATIYVKQCDYDNACANLREIFNIDSQNLPAISLLYKITKIQAQKFIDRQLYAAAAGCYMRLLKIPVLSDNTKLMPIVLELIVRHFLSFDTELCTTDISEMYKELDDQRLREGRGQCEGRDLAENDLVNVIEQQRLSRMSAVEVNTASSQMELYSDDTDVEEEWTTRKISNDRRRESYPRKMKSPIEVNTVSSRRHFVSDDTDEEEQQLTRRRSKDRRRRSHSRKSNRESIPGPSRIIHCESKEEWKVIHHKCKHMQEKITFSKRH